MNRIVRHRDDAGMTLPEVITASAILLICLTGLATLLLGAINSSQSAKMRDMAANVANARIEAARAIPYDSLGVRYANGLSGEPAGVILTPETVNGFTVDTTCNWIRTDDGRSAYKKLTVRVSWANPTAGHVEVTTMVYGRSGIVHAGDLLVTLRYRETGAPVVGSTIAVAAADGASFSVASDSRGESFFGQLAVGPVGLTITPPAGYLVDTTSLSASSVATDALSTLTAYVQRPASALVKVRSATGVGVPGSTIVIRRSDGSVLPTMTADSSGNAIVTNLLYGDYSCTVWKSGYATAVLPFSVSATDFYPTVRLVINQVTYADLLVRVKDANGTPLSGANVWVHLPSGYEYRYGSSNTAGECPMSSLEATTYVVTVSKTNYVTQVQNVAITGTSLVTVDFALQAVANGAMHVTTLDKNGHANKIQVVVSGAGYYRNDLWSDTSGSLTLTNLVPGTYTVQAYSKPASVVTVIISSAQTAEVSISQAK